MDLTPEQKRTVFYSGGLRENVELAGRTITLGELPLREFPKIFECMEADLKAAAQTYRDYVGIAPNVFRRIANKIRALLGLPDPNSTAIGLVRNMVEGLTKNDVRLIVMCARGFTDLPESEIEQAVLNAPRSQVQNAIRTALELNGIDTKKFMAARQPVPTAAARG